MAQGIYLICTICNKIIQAWSDGNPYYLDEKGKKKYAYHPDHDNLDKCIGNDVPVMCLGCGQEFKSDSRKPTTKCKKCGESNICSTYQLDGKLCPYCKVGKFKIDPDNYCIS